jgi:microcompartment protein CcmL/EutN
VSGASPSPALPLPPEAIGLIEIGSWAVSMAALDAAEKAAPVRVIQLELNDLLGASIKLAGATAADVASALAAAEQIAKQMQAHVVVAALNRPHEQSRKLWPLVEEFNPLIEQTVVHIPRENDMPEAPFAIGLIETQGFTAVIEAVDAACKAASVEVVGREKLGGGYISVVIKGDVAAVKAAVETAAAHVEGLGKLIAAHVIARPSSSVLSLLPKA